MGDPRVLARSSRSRGLVANAFQLFWARLGAGIAKSNTMPVHGSLIADTYPIGVRGRIGATLAMGARLVGRAQPAARRRDRGARRRSRRLAVAVPPARRSRSAVFALFAFRCPSRRGVSSRSRTCSARSSRTPSRRRSPWRRRSRGCGRSARSRAVIVAFAAIGLRSLHRPGARQPVHGGGVRHQDVRSGGARARSAGSASCRACLRRSLLRPLVPAGPGPALRLVGLLILPAAVLTPVQYFMPNAVLFTIFGIPQIVLLSWRSRWSVRSCSRSCPTDCVGMGAALGSIYIFFIGATGGALLSALLTDEFGPRVAVLAIVVPSHDHRRASSSSAVHGSSATTSRWSSPSSARRWRSTTRQQEAPDDVPVAPGRRRRLLLRAGAGAVRRRLRGAPGRGARAARHQRRGQVDDPARDRRPWHAAAASCA